MRLSDDCLLSRLATGNKSVYNTNSINTFFKLVQSKASMALSEFPPYSPKTEYIVGLSSTLDLLFNSDIMLTAFFFF